LNFQLIHSEFIRGGARNRGENIDERQAFLERLKSNLQVMKKFSHKLTNGKILPGMRDKDDLAIF
jgi:hypothetical protein